MKKRNLQPFPYEKERAFATFPDPILQMEVVAGVLYIRTCCKLYRACVRTSKRKMAEKGFRFRVVRTRKVILNGK